MKFILSGLLVAAWPFLALAQGNSVLEQGPPRDDAVEAAPMAPDDTVTAAPLPPPDQEMPRDDQAEPEQQMVPNPLDNPEPNRGRRKTARETDRDSGKGTPVRGNWLPMGVASLQTLDKVNARATNVTVKVGESVKVGSLDVLVRGCYVRSPDRPADATAFLVVRDHQSDPPVFTGWMVRSAPSMSMMAHPIYDIRVTGCPS